MARFSERHGGYKVGIVLLLLATIAASYGVIAPGWIQYKSTAKTTIFAALWWQCKGYLFHCTPVDIELFGETDIAVIALEVAGLFCLLCSAFYAVYVNWCSQTQRHHRLIEITAFMAAIPILTGAVVFVRYSFTIVHDLPGVDYGPSFILCCVSALTTCVAGVLIAVFNECTPVHNGTFEIRKIPLRSHAVCTNDYPGHNYKQFA